MAHRNKKSGTRAQIFKNTGFLSKKTLLTWVTDAIQSSYVYLALGPIKINLVSIVFSYMCLCVDICVYTSIKSLKFLFLRGSCYRLICICSFLAMGVARS